MCGIAGTQTRTAAEPVDARALIEVTAAMTSALVHRGPDDVGFAHCGDTSLGVRRLSIVDVAGGKQPIANEDGTVVAVLNGEIYNHVALRADLAARGHHFRTRSDTEVLVHGWEEWGSDLPTRLSGMFAFAIHDAKGGTLFLARDRFGQKPLFYAETRGAFVFASEMRALARHPQAPRDIDPAALAAYLALATVPAPRTILSGVRKLLPGGTLLVRGGRIQAATGRPPLAFQPKHSLTESDARAELWTRLVAAAASHLQGDVPVGVFLSGGIDSGAVAAAIRAADPARVLPSFAIGFDDPEFDELTHARDTARFLGTDHHERVLSAEDIAAIACDLPRVLDEPTADSSILPTLALARLAASSVKVALSGDGGDEVFAGYRSFAAQRWADRWTSLVPGTVESMLVNPAVSLLPRGDSHRSASARARQFLRGARLPPALRPWGWMMAFSAADLAAVHAQWQSDADVFLDARLAAKDADTRDDTTDRASRVLLRTYLPDDLLAKTDVASMSASLEVRAPLLDDGFAAWAIRLPTSMKSRGQTGKWVLREALRGRLPDAALRRGKQGFAIPLARWLRPTTAHALPFADWAADAALTAARDLSPLLREGTVSNIIDQHRSGRADRAKELWSLAALGAWSSGGTDLPTR